MVRFYEKNSPIKYPRKVLKEGGAATIEDFACIYYEEAKAEGIKGISSLGSNNERNGRAKIWWKVRIEQYNLAGIGATDGGACGASFKDVRTGVRAKFSI